MSTSPTQQHQKSRAKKAAFAAFIGTTIEWYDFYIYAFSVPIVFDVLFFPEGTDRLTAIAAGFAGTAVGFLARPLGAVIFGHIGDRWGRRPALVMTLTLMGTATFMIGVLPTYAAVGVAAPILLVLLRLIQGLAVGGEWGGAVLMSVEHADQNKKTFYGSFTQLGNPAGALMATSLLSLLVGVFGEDSFADFGWRIPFLLSAVLVIVGFIVRQKVEESPVFKTETAAVQQQNIRQKAPLISALHENWANMLLGVGALPVATGGYYLITTFATTYATDPSVGHSETLILNALSVASIVELGATILFGWLGDKLGRKPVIIGGSIATALLGPPMFLGLGGDNVVLIFLLVAVLRLAMSATYGPMAAAMSQIFRPLSRYTSVSLTYQMAGAIFGGLIPIAATLSFQATASIWPTIGMLAAMCALGAVCMGFAPQRQDTPSQPTLRTGEATA
ncbi:MFS transporter [Rothia sp. HC945]|jgi:MFS family permease|uniref:MFS transporter n=1 Tax=Rothia sp. HC945 TaxID=3171170 RepID=UPI002656D37E|nr:MHS family MFS transporter [Kocuria sp.]MDN5653784.1 MHS family MFS transporter [Kocuria sp.]